MELCLGVSLLPPEPQIVDSEVAAFNPSVAFREVIKPPPPQDSYRLEPPAKMQSSLLAGPAFEPGGEPAARWQDFANAWSTGYSNAKPILEGAAENGEQQPGLLKLASSWLGWDAPPPGNRSSEAVGARLPWDLTSELPKTLVGSLGEEYAVLPRLGLVSA